MKFAEAEDWDLGSPMESGDPPQESSIAGWKILVERRLVVVTTPRGARWVREHLWSSAADIQMENFRADSRWLRSVGFSRSVTADIC